MLVNGRIENAKTLRRIRDISRERFTHPPFNNHFALIEWRMQILPIKIIPKKTGSEKCSRRTFFPVGRLATLRKTFILISILIIISWEIVCLMKRASLAIYICL